MAGDLNAAVLADLLNPELDAGSQVIAVDENHRVLYDTTMGPVADSAALLAAGSLHTTLNNTAVLDAFRTKGAGVLRYTDQQGHDLIGGFDVIDQLGWAILVQDSANTVLGPVRSQRNHAIIIVILGILVAVMAALIFGTREATKLRAMANQTSASGLEVNSAAAELSASSEELAATTTEQSAAVTEASATTEELARASAAIADTVDEVARLSGRDSWKKQPPAPALPTEVARKTSETYVEAYRQLTGRTLNG